LVALNKMYNRVKAMSALAGPTGITPPTTVFGANGGGKSNASMLEPILGAKILAGELGGKAGK